LIQQPNSLVATVLKGKYFARDSLLQAKLGASPSYTWHSMLKARPIMHQGLMWRIRNGEKVRIWGDKWIPSSPDRRVHSLVQVLHHEASVIALLDQKSGWWNYGLIHYIFNLEEVAKVCSLVISPLKQKDKMIWMGSKSGCFLVRSAYHLEMSTLVQDKGQTSSTGDTQCFWKALWNLQSPPILKYFL
jgi:hypothetical protein